MRSKVEGKVWVKRRHGMRLIWVKVVWMCKWERTEGKNEGESCSEGGNGLKKSKAGGKRRKGIKS